MRKDGPKIADILWNLNQFLYVSTKDTPEDFVSTYHKFWEENHEEILGIQVSETRCAEVASRFEHIFATHERLRPRIDTGVSLAPELVANARFFTAIQDFTIRFRQSPYAIASRRPELFNPTEILKREELIDDLLRELGADSQYDKRRKFAKLSAELLIEKYESQAFNIPVVHKQDAVEVRNALTDNPDQRFRKTLGFSEKKANMLIRDMYELGIWSSLTNLEKLDVSSDMNTMRIALRTGIVRTRIPLLTSYLDTYCYQYGAIDSAVSKAWRKTWEIWGATADNHRVAAPAFFDFLIFKLGQICCKPKTRACENPCSGSKLQKLLELIHDSDGYCPLVGICEKSTRILNPPRSISIYGRTGWKSGETDEGGGGGISS